MIVSSLPSYAMAKPYGPVRKAENAPLSGFAAPPQSPTRLQSFDLGTPVGKLHVWKHPAISMNPIHPLSSGKPMMLLIHGWGGRAENMGSLVEKLAPSFPDWSFVAITLPEISESTGHGPPPHHFSQQSVAQVRNTIDFLSSQAGQPQLYVLGYSLGAPITVHALAQLQPQARQNQPKLLLLSPALDFSPSLNQTLSEQDRRQWAADSPEWLRWSHDAQLRPYMRESVNLLRRGLNRIDRCLFVSPNDTAVSLPAIRQSLRQNSEMQVIASGSHESIDNPELVQQVVNWLNIQESNRV